MGLVSATHSLVFGIQVCTPLCNVNFILTWYLAFPHEYLEQISDSPSGLKPNHIVWQKMYPVSEYGLNCCDPQERIEILRLLVGILDYFERGVPQVGDIDVFFYCISINILY